MGKKVGCVGEVGGQDCGADSTGCVHLDLVFKAWFCERFCGEVTCCYEDDVEVRYLVILEMGGECLACFGSCDVDVGDVGYVFGWNG